MAGEDITVAQLRQLLGVQAELRQQAESRWQGAQRALVSLLETFDPEEVDRRLKSGQPLDNLKVEELAALITRPFHARMRRVQETKNASESSEALQTLKSQLQTAQGEIDQLRKKNQHLSEETQLLREERDDLANQLAALQQVTVVQAQQPAVNPNGHHPNGAARHIGAPEPDWMAAWRKMDTFERDAAVLRLIGETGLARRPLIEGQAAEILGIRKAGGSLQALLSRLEMLQLIEIFRPWSRDGAKTGGRAPDMVRLAERGRLAYWLQTSAGPVENEYDALLTRHVSPEHTLLNLQAADTLRDAGYHVNLLPPDVHLPDGGLFKPDLLAINSTGKTLYIEVETGASKNHEQRQAKWRNAMQAGGGQIYIFCDNRTCMRAIRSEINFSLGRQGVQCSLTNLADLQNGKRATDGGIWLDVRLNRAIT
jgi:hypothetical protein